MSGVVRVLVVDDSAYVRKVIKEMLSRSPFIDVVGSAHDGMEALEMVRELKPDVLTLDLMMPNLDGIGFIERQMSINPIPIVVVSIANQSSEMVLKALDAGAIDFIQKPSALATEKVLDMADDLVTKVKTAALVRMKQPPAPNASVPPVQAVCSRSSASQRVDIVVIGISTGGPQALKYLIPRLPEDFPVPIAIVIHMPVGYTEMYAAKLNEISSLSVVEARHGDEIRAGTVLIAPAGRHLTLRRNAENVVVAHLDAQPFDTLHRPSVDVLFQSAAESFGDRVLGVVMTGMGSDGKQGAAWIKAKGGTVITEAEDSCVVYGMPLSVVEGGLSDRAVTLTGMAEAIAEAV